MAWINADGVLLNTNHINRIHHIDGDKRDSLHNCVVAELGSDGRSVAVKLTPAPVVLCLGRAIMDSLSKAVADGCPLIDMDEVIALAEGVRR